MPVELNEPLNTLQHMCEELEYTELLDKAADTDDPYERMVRPAPLTKCTDAHSHMNTHSCPHSFTHSLTHAYPCGYINTSQVSHTH